MTFQRIQRELTDHLRQPARRKPPAGIEGRRLAIYRDLIFNNIEGFLSGGFPVLRSIYRDEAWLALVRDFIASHLCQSPYFLEISEEFLAYLQLERGERPDDPPFLRELAHYEWVELALDVALDEADDIAVDPAGDLLQGKPVLSSLAWPLAYRFPVHRIGPSFQPDTPDDEGCFLVVYRNPDDEVGFIEINAVTFALLELLQVPELDSGAEALDQLAQQLQYPQPAQLQTFGLEILSQLRAASVIAGTKR